MKMQYSIILILKKIQSYRKKAIAKNTHCIFFILSFKIQTANKAVKMGDKYWIVTALAKGIFWSVMKNNVNAVTPIKPLIKSIFLLTPKTGIFLLFNDYSDNQWL